MPELAEVEVARRNVAGWWEGEAAAEVRLLDAKVLKKGSARELEEAMLRPLVAMRRRGKYLWAELEGGHAVMFHFRMTGKITCETTPQPRFARLAWRVDKTGWLTFKDSRRLGHVEVLAPGELERYDALLRMGKEPHDITVDELREAASDRRQLKSALLDQGVVAGVGNIAISELFWRLQLPPEVRCGELSQAQWEALVEEMPRYFDEIIARSMADEIAYMNEAGGENIFEVYGRKGEACPRCEEAIERVKVAGRSTYFCPACQPPVNA
ncbi:Fpg/Nei family DNA glycosylase [Lujinxingia vulgaris]|nr:DNA-formamidopyrimidine glycosylase family protein [Lujinxingia vulgaris]